MELVRSEAIICIAEFKAKEGKRKELLKALTELIPLSRSEAGCVRYELHESCDDEKKFVFVDRFKDQAAWDFHCVTDYINDYFDNILPGLTESIEYKIFREIDIK